jgi:hypothetical protein
MVDPDADLAGMNEEALRAEVRKLRAAIREQRDQTGHDLCWYLPELWDVLPEKVHPQPELPPWPEFIQRCAAFRQQLEEKK